MAPPGTEVLIHDTPQQRRAWEFHGKEGWYIGMDPLHYQCYRIYILETRGERISKTVQFFSHNGAMPAMSSADADIYAATVLADVFANPAPSAPFDRFGAQTIDVIRQLANVFAATRAPTPNPTPPPRRTCATMHLHRLQCDTDPQSPTRVPPTVPPFHPPRPTPAPPPRVRGPARNPPHR